MSYVSFGFLLFTSVCFGLYYILPQKFRRYVLLAASVCFYVIFSKYLIAASALIALFVYLISNKIGKIDEKFSLKKKELSKEERKDSKDTAKERLHLVLMQDRANVSADFMELMKQEIIEVIKKYIDVDENSIDVKLTNKVNSDGTTGAPMLYANIPIVNLREDAKQVKVENKDKKESKKEDKDKKIKPEDKKDELKVTVTEAEENVEEKVEEKNENQVKEDSTKQELTEKNEEKTKKEEKVKQDSNKKETKNVIKIELKKEDKSEDIIKDETAKEVKKEKEEKNSNKKEEVKENKEENTDKIEEV